MSPGGHLYDAALDVKLGYAFHGRSMGNPKQATKGTPRKY